MYFKGLCIVFNQTCITFLLSFLFEIRNPTYINPTTPNPRNPTNIKTWSSGMCIYISYTSTLYTCTLYLWCSHVMSDSSWVTWRKQRWRNLRASRIAWRRQGSRNDTKGHMEETVTWRKHELQMLTIANADDHLPGAPVRRAPVGWAPPMEGHVIFNHRPSWEGPPLQQ